MTVRNTMRSGLVVLAAAALLGACTSTKAGTGSTPAGGATGANQFFKQADFDRQKAQRGMTPQGDPTTPWLQAIDPSYVDTAKYAKPAGNWNVCFSNAGVGNPWRVTGMTTMKAEAKLHKEISSLTVVDAESKDDKQISDLADLQAKNCSAIIVSPNTTAALTPAVEKACQTGVPVVVFDRGVNTDCPVTFVHGIGGYAFGATAAEFIAGHVGKGAKILALRILPGVDVLENRWAAAKVVFDQAGDKVVGSEFTGGDPAKVKTIVADYIQRFGKIDGVWMDAGATTVAAVEAFEDAGAAVPPINGEDQEDFLELWQQKHLTAIAPTYPVYMWRTALIAATDILSGKQVPKEWVLPQPVITNDNLSQYVRTGMPPLFYPTCGCQQLPGFPGDWGGK
jgi:ribose transport system substrate-binding protein